MDKILLGISASAHQEGVKKALFLKMMSTASKPLSKEEVTTILQLSSCWVIGEEEFLQDMGLQVGLLQLKCYLLLNCVSYLSAHKTHFCLCFPWSIFAFPIRHRMPVFRHTPPHSKACQVSFCTAHISDFNMSEYIFGLIWWNQLVSLLRKDVTKAK